MGNKPRFYTVRFWNQANENIKIAGKYSHTFSTEEDAWNAANALLLSAYKNGADAMDINNDFYAIEE